MKTPFHKIGIDLGGTKTEAVILDENDKERFRSRISTPRETGPNEYSRILAALCGLILQTIGKIPSGTPLSIGIGMPGSLEPQTGLIRNSNTVCLNGKPLKADIEARIERPVEMENDANCFTFAESYVGAAKQLSVVFGIIMGTGCGGGICIDGRIHKGRNGIGGEWGHFSIDPNGSDCYCGNRGCIETKISGTGVEESYHIQSRHYLPMEQILSGFRDKDPDCSRIFLQFLENFGRSVGGLISLLDPDAVVIGGGLSNIDELYTLGVEKIRQYAFHPHIDTPILKNALGDSAGVLGAAWIGALQDIGTNRDRIAG